ncbi:MAG: hypothetical protein EBX52_07710 [Proteobacteria bacterium]|nr:hypothetical protein [Pseudomonadota bacterium]
MVRKGRGLALIMLISSSLFGSASCVPKLDASSEFSLTSSYSATSGSPFLSQTITVTGNRLKSGDTLRIGGSTCIPMSVPASDGSYTCTLPAFCQIGTSCAVGGTLPVSLTLGGQVWSLPEYTVTSPDSAIPGNAVTYSGVHSAASDSIDLVARVLSKDGGQNVFLGFSQSPCSQGVCGRDAIVSVKIGNLYQAACQNLRPDPRGGYFYECSLGSFQGITARSGLHRLLVTFKDGSSLAYENAFEVMNFTRDQVERMAGYCNVDSPCGVGASNNPVQYPDEAPRVWAAYVANLFKMMGRI